MNNSTTPPSFTFFNQLEDPKVLQFLEQYCSAIQKKEKDAFENKKKLNFFMEDQEQVSNLPQNIFSYTFSKPSICFFQYKQPQEEFIKQSQAKEKPLQSNQVKIQCKIQYQHEVQNTNENQDENNPYFENGLQENVIHESVLDKKIKKQERQMRLNEIIREVTFAKNELLDMIDFFEQNVRNK